MRTAQWETSRVGPERAGLSASLILLWIFLLVAVVLLLDPLNPGVFTESGYLRLPRDIGPPKYIAHFFGLLGLGLSIVGLQLSDTERWKRLASYLQASWPIIVFSLLILAGSFFARFVSGIKESFLASGLGLLAFPMGLAMMVESRHPVKTIQTYFTLLMLASIYMMVEIVINRRLDGQAFHEEIFLLLPLGVYWFLINESRWLAWLGVLGLATIGFISYKNTSYLVMLLIFAYLFSLGLSGNFSRHRGDDLKRVLVGYGFFLFLAAAIVVLVLVYLHYRQEMPTGSADVRLYIYQVAWEKFLSSPIYGTGFTDNTNIEFPLARIMGHYQVINHSDLMDVLMHGGLLGLALLLASLYVPYRGRLSSAVNQDRRVYAARHGLMAINFSGMIVMAFNPVMLNLPASTLFWFSAGLLAGLRWMYRRPPPAADAEYFETPKV